MFGIGVTEFVVIAVIASVPLVLLFLFFRALRQGTKDGREAAQYENHGRAQHEKVRDPNPTRDSKGEETL